MPIKVLVVDDSGFFRRRVTEILNADPGIEVVDSAKDGLEAVQKVIKCKPDVVTMDIEMPVLDGISAVRRIMAIKPTPVLMFSSLTYEGATATLDALDAGAMDFLPKKFEDVSKDREQAKRLLCSRVRAIAGKNSTARAHVAAVQKHDTRIAKPPPRPVHHVQGVDHYSMILIGTSTGGPAALQRILSHIPPGFKTPILLVQHMPATFTAAFAQRLDQMSQITITEAADGDIITPGHAYLAPGGKQMVVSRAGGRLILKVKESPPNQNYKPCVDTTFTSAAEYVRGNMLVIIMTGMGADGREGTRLLKQKGATVWAQDESSCVVYGMPMSVVEAGLADSVFSLTEIGNHLAHKV